MKKLPENIRSLVEENPYYWKKKPKVFWPKEKIRKNKPTAVDLFCGLGGLSLGFEMAGFDVVLGLDIHEPSVKTFRESHPKAAVIMGDITKIISLDQSNSGCLIEKVLNKVVGNREIDVLMAGIPCQGFSLFNKKRSILDERNYLFLYFIEVARLLQPKYILIENVVGLKAMNNGSFVEDIEEAIREEEYKVESRILNAADFGVPQTRRRVFFIGAKSNYPIIWPYREYGSKSKPWRTVRDAISDLPPLDPGEVSTEYLNGMNLTEYQKLMRGDNKFLKNHEAPSHPKETVERISCTKPGESMYKSYSQRIRLSWDSPSPTQVSGGIRPQFQFGHPEQPRGLTVRERCRIQSIPDHVEVFGGIVQGRVQTGNAVPPLLAKAIAEMMHFGLKVPEIRKHLMKWSEVNLRVFPWRASNASPYEVLVSEILLRKTRAESVEQVYKKFIAKYSSIDKLANADVKELEQEIKQLGLSKIRANALKEMAKIIVTKHLGMIPKDTETLMKITHLGRYIANATLSFGYGMKKPIVDENIQRILNRVFGIRKAVEIHKADHLWNLADKLIPENNFKKFSWALLDFAALVCTANKPKCDVCPINHICKYYGTDLPKS